MNSGQKGIVITAAVRTAIGTFNGSLKNLQGHDLGSAVVKEAMKKSKLNSEEIDELIMGQVLTSAAGQNPARQAAIQAGLAKEKTAYVIKVKALRYRLKIAKDRKEITNKEFWNIYKKIGGNTVRNSAHMRTLIEELKTKRKD